MTNLTLRKAMTKSTLTEQLEYLDFINNFYLFEDGDFNQIVLDTNTGKWWIRIFVGSEASEDGYENHSEKYDIVFDAWQGLKELRQGGRK